jgi:uncharacterized protein (DUF433 family)
MMAAERAMLRTTEAAAVSGVSVREVNRAIDEGILPTGFTSIENGRTLVPAACMVISFYFGSAGSLTTDERMRTIAHAESRLRGWPSSEPLNDNWIVTHEFLTIDLAPFAKRVTENLDRLDAARKLVVSSPDILGGMPVIRGTRIVVYDVAASYGAGCSIERILEAYPRLDAEAIALAVLYAEANPPRGRPKGARALPPGAVLISESREPRRSAGG